MLGTQLQSKSSSRIQYFEVSDEAAKLFECTDVPTGRYAS